jgi:hypothetical protein
MDRDIIRTFKAAQRWLGSSAIELTEVNRRAMQLDLGFEKVYSRRQCNDMSFVITGLWMMDWSRSGKRCRGDGGAPTRCLGTIMPQIRLVTP